MKNNAKSIFNIAHPLIVATLTAAPQVYAQSSEKPKEQVSVVEEVLVTAQRRSERLEEVPLSITVATGEQLDQAGVNSIEDISKIAAGVQVNRGGAFSQPAIRGISTLTLGGGLENNVAVYIDGVYQPDAVAINSELANIGTMQILKGPQGTLYGRNATGGAIVIETLKPTEELEGNLQLSLGRFSDNQFSGYVSGPIQAGLTYSIAANWRENDGYITDIGADPNSTHDDTDAAPLKSESLRGKLYFSPADSLDITLGYNYISHLDARGLAYRIPDYAASYLPAPPERATAKDQVSLNQKADNLMELDEFTAKIDWSTDFGTLTSVTAHSERTSHSNFDFDGSLLDIVRSVSENNEQFTIQQSLNYNIDAFDRWNIHIGGMYYRDRYRVNEAKSYRSFSLVQVYNLQLDSEAFSAYVDATWELADSWFLTVGARYSAEDRGGAYQFVYSSSNPPDPADKDNDYSATTPRLVLRHELSDQTNIYASYTAGFRSGTFYSGTQPDPDVYNSVDQEEIDAYEIGFKTAQSRYRLSAAAFYYDYTDLQIGLTVQDPNVGIIQQIFNAPEAEVYGAEIQIDFVATESLDFRAGLSYVHGRYTDFPDITGVGLDSANQSNISPQAQDWTDQEMARAPEWTANAGANYTIETSIGSIVTSVSANYTDSYVVQNLSLYGPVAAPEFSANEQRYRQDSFTLINAKIDWTDSSGRFTAGLYGENITNKRYYLTHSGSSLGDYNQYSSPSSYGIRFGYNF